MKILLVNSNTTEHVTDKIAEEARRAASPGTEIVAVTATFGPRLVTSRSEDVISAHAALSLVADHHARCDAVVIGMSNATGMHAAREMIPLPVVGITEAALFTACMLGGRFGMVTVARRITPIYRELIERHGRTGRLAGMRVVEAGAAAYAPGDHAEIEATYAAAARELVEKDGADVVILAGSIMAGVPRRIQADVPVPVLEGISCGVLQAELLVRLGAPKPRTVVKPASSVFFAFATARTA